MKRIKNIFEKIIAFENLLSAARKAQKAKRFKPATARFNINLERELIAIQDQLITKSYKSGKYVAFTIYDPKKRLISAAPYRDRVVHHALCNIIEPVFEKMFIYDTYANRKNKGTHRAINRYQEFAKKNRYVLKCDVVKYFPSIDHEILKQEIRRKISDPDALWLIDTIIDGSNPQESVLQYFPGDELFTPITRKKGLPIGNLTSQFFANIYLNRFDHYLKEELRCRYYIRYVDDWVVFSDDKLFLHHVRACSEAFLAKYRLFIHPDKSKIHAVRSGLTFLGHRIFPTHRLLKKDNIRRFRTRMKQYEIQYAQGRISLEKIGQSLQSWIAHASFSNTYRLRRKLFKEFSFTRGQA